MARIKDARVSAAHDGIAELIVRIEYDNGGISEVALDETATSALLKSCNTETLEGLIGQPWQKVRDALQVSYNRYQ